MSWKIEKTTVGADIVVSGFEGGIADSPYEGISDMRNMNIISVPEEASVNFKTQSVQQTPISAQTFTVTASNDTFTYSGTQLKVGSTIVLNSLVGGTGLATATNYWILSATATTFTVTASVRGSGILNAIVNVTADGSGTFSTVNLALITQIATEDNQNYYGIDTNARVWVYKTNATDTNWIYLGNTVTASTPPDFNTGIAVWKSYIIALYNGASGPGLYTCKTNTNPAAFTFFKSLSNIATHRTFVDKNTTLYWCDGNQIGSLIELTTFNPATSSTYTYSQAALSIQTNDTSQCIEQLGTNLLIGASFNQVYQWDRFSTGYTPILIPENNVHRMVTVNSNTYFFAGARGRIYITNGANAELYKKIPDHLSGTIEPTFVWGGATYTKNQLYFSATAFSPTAPGTSIDAYGGIWAIDVNTDAMRLINQLSYGTYAGYTAEIFPTISTIQSSTSGVTVPTFGVLTGWEDSTESSTPNYGSDITSIKTLPTIPNVPYSNYESYVDTDMIPVGTYLNPNTDANVEYKLTVPMVSGEGVKLSYRQDLSQSFTPITSADRPTGEFTSADAYGGLSGVIQVNFQKSQWLQIRCFTKSTSTTPSYTRLKEMRIR